MTIRNAPAVDTWRVLWLTDTCPLDVALDGHHLSVHGRDPRDPMNPWPPTRPCGAVMIAVNDPTDFATTELRCGEGHTINLGGDAKSPWYRCPRADRFGHGGCGHPSTLHSMVRGCCIVEGCACTLR